MLGIALLLFQYMISAKAGLVNYVDGQANVHLHEQVAEGRLIETQGQGHVELLLTPGSFLRMGSNSKVILDSVELNKVVVRMVEGTTLVEVAEIQKDAPIAVNTSNLHSVIVSRGIYRFSEETESVASVVDGKLRLPEAHITVKKGHQVTSAGAGYMAASFAVPNDDLDRWSQNRSSALANANAVAYNERSGGMVTSLAYYPYWNFYSSRSSWLYSPFLGGFTFIPGGSYRSYYGYSFIGGSAFAALPLLPARPGGPLRAPGRTGSSAGASTSHPAPGGGGFHAPAGGHGSHGPAFHGGGRGGRR